MTSAADDEAAASSGCEEIAVREKEISGITNRLLSSAPDYPLEDGEDWYYVDEV